MDWVWLGRMEYGAALDAQRAQRARRIAGEVGDTLWLLEHEPVITTGRRAVDDLPPPERLAAAGFHHYATERGGLATCHEPGQLVGYVLMDVRRLGVRRLVDAVEDGLLRWLSERGVEGGRREGYPGVWVGQDKIAAVGLNAQQGFTLHGFALNLCNDRAGFGLITPCGIRDGGVTTFQLLTGQKLEPAEAAPTIAASVCGSVLDALGLVA